MTLRTLHRGIKGPAVRRWQTFLRGRDLYFGKIDGDFGGLSEAATKQLQERAFWEGFAVGKPDGWVGSRTYGYAATQGFELVPPIVSSVTTGQAWPARPANLRPLGSAGRRREFGNFRYVAAPTKQNPERIEIRERRGLKLVNLHLPQLVGAPGFPASGKILVHARVADQLAELVQAWHSARLIHRCITGWSGSYSARFIRGSTKTLSSHSWGSAFDINYMGNQLGRVPALRGELGSVRELVPLAIEHGFYWGGWFTRKDGMHFECCEPRGPRI